MPGDVLISTREGPGEFDALAKLRPGEPYFALIGRDRLATPLVILWAERNRVRALREFSDGLIDSDTRNHELAKSTQAEETAWAMADYKAGYKDVPETRETVSYTGHVLPEETKRSDERQRACARAVAALNNAIAEATDYLPFMEGDQSQLFIEKTIQEMRAAVTALVPPRPGVSSHE